MRKMYSIFLFNVAFISLLRIDKVVRIMPCLG